MAENPAFDITDYRLVRFAGRTLAEAHLKHAEESDHRIEGIIFSLREAPLISLMRSFTTVRQALGMPPSQLNQHRSQQRIVAFR